MKKKESGGQRSYDQYTFIKRDQHQGFRRYRKQRWKKIRKNCLIRSSKLTNVRKEDLEYLCKVHRLSEIIDLRTFTEVEEDADRAEDVEYRHIPIIKDFKDGITHENRDTMKMPDLADTYEDMVCREEYIDGMKNVLNEIMDHDYKAGAVLWHCSEGKDRCGLISALVMMLLNVDEETIRKDYLETNRTSIPRAETIYKKIMESGSIEVAESVYRALIADERYLDAALKYIDEEFLTGKMGLDPEKIEEFRNKVLE